jgi:hypothetical protein
MTKPTAPFAVRVVGPGVSVIEIVGEVTRESENALNDAYARAGDGARTIILAFDRLQYLNSSGIGLLVRCSCGPSATTNGYSLTASPGITVRSSS